MFFSFKEFLILLISIDFIAIRSKRSTSINPKSATLPL